MLKSSLNSNNYLLVDKNLLKLVGPQTALLISYIASVASEDGIFDSKEINKDLGLSSIETSSLLKRVSEANIISNCSGTEYKLNLDVVYGFLNSDTKPLIKSRNEEKDIRNGYIIANIKKSISETDDEIRNSIEAWVDAIFQVSGMNTATLKSFESTLNKYTSNKESKVEIIKIATERGYRNVDWAIRDYTKNQLLKNNSLVVTNPIFDSEVSY